LPESLFDSGLVRLEVASAWRGFVASESRLG